MTLMQDIDITNIQPNISISSDEIVKCAWETISPFWPISNLIAVNPLSGLEKLPFHDALMQGQKLFSQADLPEQVRELNRQSIKWLQVYFDYGQSTISMPNRYPSLLKTLLGYLKSEYKHQKWLKTLPESNSEILFACLQKLKLNHQDACTTDHRWPGISKSPRKCFAEKAHE